MVSHLRRRWARFLIWLAFSWLIIIATAQLTIRQYDYDLPLASIQHSTGCAYVVNFDAHPFAWPIYSFIGDSNLNPHVSNLTLLKDGHAIGKPHSTPEVIRENGGGDYSHWERSIIFSLPDCIDPRSGGSSFAVRIEPSLSRWAHLSSLAAAILAATSIIFLSVNRQQVSRNAGGMVKAIDYLIRPIIVAGWSVLGSAVLFTLMLGGIGFLLWHWITGRSLGLAVSGFYQISDSMIYWLCANALIDFGNFGHPLNTGEWCHRRAIYPTLLSGIAWIAQRDIYLTLVAQSVAVVVAIYIAARRCATISGIVGMFLCAILLFRYAMADVFALTMTENAGLIFGCIGLASLLVASEKRSSVWMVCGIALLSVALNARAGAFFVLPLLVCWSGHLAHVSKGSTYKWVMLALAAASSGFVLQAALVTAVGGSATSSHGNFSYVLYGLSLGGQGWQQVLVDHPELSGSDATMSKAIYAMAWQNVHSHPELFLSGLWKNFLLFVTHGTYGFEKLAGGALFIKCMWWLAWIPLYVNRRKTSYSLIAAGSLGVALSTPLLLADGGPRSFAATVALDVLQISIGFSWMLMVVVQKIVNRPSSVSTICGHLLLEPSGNKARLETAFVSLLALLLLIPYTPLRYLQKYEISNASASGIPCSNQEYTLITHFGGGGSLLLSFVESSQMRDVYAGEVMYSAFIRGIPPSAWWRVEAEKFGGKSLILGYQLDSSDLSKPGPSPVFANRSLSEYYGKNVRVCIDKAEVATVFGVTYRKLNSITVLD